MDKSEREIALENLLRDIIDDASPCTSGCSRLVDEKLIERAEELTGYKYEGE